MASNERIDIDRGRSRACHLADEMHHRFAMLDVFLELRQRVAAEGLKVLLDFDLDVGPRQHTAQCVAIPADRPTRRTGIDLRLGPP